MTVQRVAILVHEGVQALDVAGPIDVFAEANGFLPAGSGYETVLVGPSTAPLRASNRMKLVPDLDLGEATENFAMVLAAGGPALPEAAPDPTLSHWLTDAAERAGLYG